MSAAADARQRADPRRWIVLVATVLAVAGTARLGFWQLDRAHQKLALQAALDERVSLPPVDAGALAVPADMAATLHHRLIRLRGHWLPGKTVFLDNRQMNGRPGFFVMSAFAVDDARGGSAHSDSEPGKPLTVLVQRGWVPRDNDDRKRLPVLKDNAEPVELTGRVAPPPARLYEFAPDASGAIRQNLRLDALGQEWSTPLLPVTILQTEPASSTPDGLKRDWPRPAIDVHKHHGYAAQWFALAALITGLYVWFQLLRPRLRRRAAD